MRKMVFALMIAFLLSGANLFAADGDLIVNGNIGIGTSTPAQKLDVVGGNIIIDNAKDYLGRDTAGGTIGMLRINSSNNTRLNAASGQNIIFTIGGTEKMRLDSTGNLGIGTSTPADQLEVYGASAGNIRLTGNRPMLRWNELDSTNTNYQIDIADGQLRFQTNNDAFTSSATVMVINQNGKVGIGTTAPTYQLQLSTNSAAKPGSSTWTVASDIRLKTNIQPYTKGLKEILQINPVSYQYNGSGGIGHSMVCTTDPCVEQDVVDAELLSKTHVGVIAQDIQAVVPETVTSHKGKINEDDKDETDILDFDSHSITFILINAVKELSAKIDSLNKQIADLKAKVK